MTFAGGVRSLCVTNRFRERCSCRAIGRRRRGAGQLKQLVAFAQPGGVKQHVARPAENVVAANHLAHPPHALTLFLAGHGQRGEERLSHRTGIVGIDDQRFQQLPGCTGERAEDENAFLVVPRRHEFLGHEVHPVVQAADDTEVGGLVDLEKFFLLVVLRQQDDGPVALPAVAVVDVGDEIEAFLVELPVCGNCSRG